MSPLKLRENFVNKFVNDKKNINKWIYNKANEAQIEQNVNDALIDLQNAVNNKTTTKNGTSR